MKGSKRAAFGRRLPVATALALILAVGLAVLAAAAGPDDLNSVIDSVRLWMAGLLVALATFFLTVGCIRT